MFFECLRQATFRWDFRGTGTTYLFEYSPEFIATGINLSPFMLPLKSQIFEDSKQTFDGLFGVFNDSLPDGWGCLLLDRQLQKKA